LILNIRFGAHGAHYGWGILGAVAGMAVSLRQILLHVMPGDTGFGNTFLELHFYTWAFVGFFFLRRCFLSVLQSVSQFRALVS
jgi:hypothetical protein